MQPCVRPPFLYFLSRNLSHSWRLGFRIPGIHFARFSVLREKRKADNLLSLMEQFAKCRDDEPLSAQHLVDRFAKSAR